MEPVWKKKAVAKANGDFISIRTRSDLGMSLDDPSAKEHLFPCDISEEVLGRAILEALAESRQLTLEEFTALRMMTAERYTS